MQLLSGLFFEIYKTFISMAPYLMLGLAFAGILHVVFKKEFIARHLGGNNFMSVLKAALLGVPLPLCSCGVVPTALSLRKSKASEGATVSFLISTPQTGVDSIVATYGMLGPVFAIFRPFAALVMGIIGGVVTNLAVKSDVKPIQASGNAFSCVICNGSDPHGHSLFEKIRAMGRYAFVDFLDDIALQLLIGIGIAGVISYFIPPDFFMTYVKNDFIGMILMMLLGIPLYVCATASIPIAMALMDKGLSPGAAFVFLACGPATNAATISLIANVMGKKIVGIYLGVIGITSLLAGFALNAFYDMANYSKSNPMSGHHHESSTTLLVETIFSALFLILLVGSIYRRIRAASRKQDGSKMQTLNTNQRVLQINGMTCNHCAEHVRTALLEVSGVTHVEVALLQKTATITGQFDNTAAKNAVAKAGYTVVSE